MSVWSSIRRHWLILAAAAAMAVASALPAAAITNGTVDEADEFPFVALVVDFQSGFLCSAGAIDAFHLITAAHCFQDVVDPPNVPVPGVFVFYGPNPLFGTPTAVSTGTWIPDEWCPGCAPGLPGFDDNDIAVVTLDVPVPLDEYVQLPSQGFTDDLRDAYKNQVPVMVAGYGVNDFEPGDGPLGENAQFDGQRRFAPASLLTSQHKHSDEYLKVSANPAKGKGGTCFGDSGSPVMYDDDGEWVMLANTSYGTNGVCAGVGYYNRMDTEEALAFVNGVLP